MFQPNIVYIISDQHRYDFMGYETNGVTHTPNLDILGKRGTIFRTTVCPAPLCSPSRAALAAGRHGMNTGCFTNLHELSHSTPTFVNQFRNAGYRTSMVGKCHMEIHAYDADYTSDKHRAFMHSLGWNDVCEISANGMFRQGITCDYSTFLKQENMFKDVLAYYENWHYFMDKERGGDPGFVPHEFPFDERYQETGFVGERALQWLEKRNRSQPFFLHVGFGGPHSPIEPMPKYMDQYCNAPETDPWHNPNPQNWLPDGRRGYRAMITQIDHWVGEIIERINDQGDLDNTLFIYTADHGEMAGDHRTFGKTRFFEASVRVPLLLAGPHIQSDQDSDALVENIDLGRTLCDLCDIEPHALDQGKSLVPVLTGETDIHRTSLYSEMGCDRMLRTDRYKLMWGDPGSDTRHLGRLHLDKPINIAPSPPRLYDLQEDPTEGNDLSEDPNYRNLLQDLLTQLHTRINENLQPRPNKSRGVYRPIRSDEL